MTAWEKKREEQKKKINEQIAEQPKTSWEKKRAEQIQKRTATTAQPKTSRPVRDGAASRRAYAKRTETADSPVVVGRTGEEQGKSVLEQALEYHGANNDVPVLDLGQQVKKTDDRTWFQKGALEDGATFMNWAKGSVATTADAKADIRAGTLRPVETAIDTAASFAPANLAAQIQGNYGDPAQQAGANIGKMLASWIMGKDANYVQDQLNEMAAKAYVESKAGTEEFIKKDLIDEQAIAKKITDYTTAEGLIANALGIDVEKNSFLGDKSDALVQSAGQLGVTAALQAAGVPWWLVSGVSAYGGEVENALQQGATLEEATASAFITAGAEILTEKLSGGIKFGGKALDDVLTQDISKKISSRFIQALAKFGVQATGEGFEEVLSDGIGKFGRWLTYQDDKTLQEMFATKEAFDEALEAFIGGAVLGGGSSIVQSVQEGRSGAQGGDNQGVVTPHQSPVATASPQGEAFGIADSSASLGMTKEGRTSTITPGSGEMTQGAEEAKPGSPEWVQEIVEQGRPANAPTQAQTGEQAMQAVIDEVLSGNTEQAVDTETQAGYDNKNGQGGVVNDASQAMQAYANQGTEADALANQGAARATDAGRSGIPSNVGEEREGSSEVYFPGGQHRGLTAVNEDFGENDYLVPQESSSLYEVQRRFHEKGIECRVVKATSWTRNAPAYAHNGRVYICENIDPVDLSTAIPHETTHVMKQQGFQPYLDFTNRTPDMLPMQNETTWNLLKMVAKHRGVDVFDMSDADLVNLYDELNAIVYGMYKSGVLKSDQYGYEWITGAFSDFEGYISELDSIHQQYIQKSMPVANESVGAAPAGFDANTHLQYEYGTLPEGENAVRPDDLPVSTDGTNRVSQTAVTVKGAKVTSDEFSDLLTKDVTERNGMTYIPITNDATVQKAIEHISNEGWEAAKGAWQADVRAGKTGADLVATGALLLNNAAKAGDKTTWLDVLHDYQILGTNTAQGLQALRILKTLAPSDKLYMVKRSVKQMVEDMKLDTDITIDPELENEYNQAETDEQRDEVLDKIQEDVARQLPTTFMEKVTALRYVNMLGNLRTQVRNIGGNLTMMGVRAIHNAVATGIEGAAHKLSGGKVERTRSLTVSKEQMAAGRKDFDNLQSVILDGRKFQDSDTATEVAKGVQDKKQIFKFKPLEGYRKLTNWAMEQGDIIFAKEAYARALAGYLKAKGITETDYTKIDVDIMDDARLFAAKEAQEATFRDTNALSGWVSKIGRRKDTPAAAKMAAEGIMPFRKTPANVLVRAEEYSPLGVINSVVTSVKAMQNGSDVTANQVINSWAKTLTGTGLFGVGMLLQSLGLLSTGLDEDENKEAFEELNGWQNYALTLPDGTNLTIDSLSPAAIPVLMGAELMHLMSDKDLTFKDVEKALTSIADPMVEMSMLQGINDTLENVRYADSNLGQFAINAALGYLTQGLTNTLAGQIERSLEDSRQQTYVDKDSAVPDWMQRAIGKASAKMPGVDYNQIPYINAWGEEEKNPEGALDWAYNLLSPAYFDKGKEDALTRELNRLNEAQGDVNVYPSAPDKSVTIDKQVYNLSAQEYEALARKQGKMQKQLVQDLIANTDYKALSDEDKAKAIRYAYDYARDSSRGEVIDDHPGVTTKWMAALKGDIAEGIIRHIATGDKYAALSIGKASFVVELLDGLIPETGKTNVRDIQKIEAVTKADGKLSEKEQQQVIEDILDDAAYAKYKKVTALGMDNDEYAESYRLYLDASGTGKKDRTIAQYQKEFRISKAVAKRIYEIYAGTK